MQRLGLCSHFKKKLNADIYSDMTQNIKKALVTQFFSKNGKVKKIEMEQNT
jgi:hypothetical protein